MNADLALWYVARVAALAAFTVLSASLLTGMAIRTALLAGVARNHAVLTLHSFLAWFWLPLVAVHVVALVLDATARVSVVDTVVPFVAVEPYAAGNGQIALALGTIGLLLVIFVGITSMFRRTMSRRLWLWVHRATYPMFVVFLAHAQMAGSDFSRTWVSLLGWATLGSLFMLVLPRAASPLLHRDRSDGEANSP